MNSSYVFGLYNQEYLVDILRSGSFFPANRTFSLPDEGQKNVDLSSLCESQFPGITEDKDEVWLKFRCSKSARTAFSLLDIESAHFYNEHRQDKASQGLIHTLKVYSIPIGPPVYEIVENLIERFFENVRLHVADTIHKTWFPNIDISAEFKEQVKVGYRYQQSPSPEKLPPLPGNYIWAQMVAYNPGLRKFEERKNVLALQDIQEVLRRTDPEFKAKLKTLGDECNMKFSDLVLDAENKLSKSKPQLTRWLTEEKLNEKSYVAKLDNFLSTPAHQQSFLYSALLYLFWRDELLNKDFSGFLGEKKEVAYFLNLNSKDNLEQARAEALFTILYAGGARVFQKALIESRKKKLNEVNNNIATDTNSDSNKDPEKPTAKSPLVKRIFSQVKFQIGKMFANTNKKITDKEKKTQIKKELSTLGLTISKISKGEFNKAQYVKLSGLFEVDVEEFEPEAGEISKQPINTIKSESQTHETIDVLSSSSIIDDVSEAPGKIDQPECDNTIPKELEIYSSHNNLDLHATAISLLQPEDNGSIEKIAEKEGNEKINTRVVDNNIREIQHKEINHEIPEIFVDESGRASLELLPTNTESHTNFPDKAASQSVSINDHLKNKEANDNKKLKSEKAATNKSGTKSKKQKANKDHSVITKLDFPEPDAS